MPVQAKLRAGVAAPEATDEMARLGVSGAGGPLPYLDVLQRAFGRHDLSGVQAHVDGAAERAATAMGAAAFARGPDVVFASAPDLHTAAHEAAHVIQQRAGIDLPGGIGRAGDRHERHADAVADAVVAGASAEALLDEYAPAAPATVVQHRYKYGGLVDVGHVWLDRSGRPFTIDPTASLTAAGVEVKFHALTPPSGAQTFTVPATFVDKKFKSVAPQAVVYEDHTGAELRVHDLDLFTGYQSPSTATAFPAIADKDHRPEFHTTAFLARVSLIPVASMHGGVLHTSSELWVKEVKVSDDRPPTKFGKEGQRSHTVAWLLLRAALQNLGGQTLNAFIALLAKMAADLGRPTASDQAGDAAVALFARVKAGLDEINDTTKVKDFSFWQRAASELVGNFVHAYQLSEAATYADGRAVGHGEAGHMATLRGVERKLATGALTPSELDDTKAAAVGMLDYKSRLGARIIGELLQHWMNDLHLAFPQLMAKHRADIVAALGLATTDLDEIKRQLGGNDPTQPIAEIANKRTHLDVVSGRTPAETALPVENRATFVANVVLAPTASAPRVNLDNAQIDKTGTSAPAGATVALGSFRIEQLQIEALAVADDRPNTRFGVLQRSHTVAWTLVRRHLMGFGGKPASVLANFVLNELTTLKGDIDGPSNKKIGFDAPAEAEAKRTNLAAIITDPAGFPLHQWQTLLSELVETYVTLYQLSRSATYSKEERPKGHGEAAACATLKNADDQLAAGGIPDLDQFFKDNRKDILEAAVKLVDAAIATRSLRPENWKIAIEHWLHLVKDQYPRVAALPGFADAIEKQVSVMEPQEELLAGYGGKLSERDKVIINLYENARNEVRSVPKGLAHDLKTSIRLTLAELKPPDYDRWDDIVSGLQLSEAQMRPWQKVLQVYQTPRRRGVSSDLPGPDAIKKMIDDVASYFEQVKNDRGRIIELLYQSLLNKASGYPETLDFVGSQAVAIQEALGKGFDEAIELSAIGTYQNYNDWYVLINSIEQDKKVDYPTLIQAIDEAAKKPKPTMAAKLKAAKTPKTAKTAEAAKPAKDKGIKKPHKVRDKKEKEREKKNPTRG